MTDVDPPVASEGRVPYSLGDLVRYFLVLGTVGFGGPIWVKTLPEPLVILAAGLIGVLAAS